jgi:hypothetical protein
MLKFCKNIIVSYGLGTQSKLRDTAEFISITMSLAALVIFGNIDKPVFREMDNNHLFLGLKSVIASSSCQRATTLFTLLVFFPKKVMFLVQRMSLVHQILTVMHYLNLMMVLNYLISVKLISI